MQKLVHCYEVSFRNPLKNNTTGEYYVVHGRIPELTINLGTKKTVLVAETHLRAIDCYGGGIADKTLLRPNSMWVGSVSEKMDGNTKPSGFKYRMVEVVDQQNK